MSGESTIERIEAAWRKSVALKKLCIENGWHPPGKPSEWPEETPEERNARLEKREFNYAVDLIGVTLSEARAAIKEDGRFYSEGGSGGRIYDLMITPRDVFDAEGICTEQEGHVCVVIDQQGSFHLKGGKLIGHGSLKEAA